MKRYDIDCEGVDHEHPNGKFVLYTDYAALLEAAKLLAADVACSRSDVIQRHTPQLLQPDANNAIKLWNATIAYGQSSKAVDANPIARALIEGREIP